MLAPMNPPASFDYKQPSAFAHHHAMPLEPQHDDFDAPHHGAHYASHHHNGYAHAWSNHAGLTGFGAAFDHADNHDDEDDDDDDEPTHDDYAASSSDAKPRKPRKPSSAAGSGKKEVFVCPEVHCGKTFPRSFALRRHMRIHTGTKPYACDVDGCAQRFNTSGNLSRHKRIHSGERPYPCVFASCGKRFNTSTKLKRHMRIHFPDGQSLFHCVQHACTFACDNYKEYVHHQRQHGNPAYAAAPKPGDDENVDRSNLPATAKGTSAKAKAATGGAKAKRAVAQPRVSKASKAAAAATTAALTGDYRVDHQSPTTTAASAGLSMLMKEAHRDDEYHQPHADLRRRLPFPTGAFPSESIAGASPMNLNLATTFGATFANARTSSSSASSSSAAFYDHQANASSSFPSYLRGDAYGQQQQQQQHHHPSHHQSQSHHHHAAAAYHDHFPPLRPEDHGDDGYDSASPRSQHHQGHHQGHHHHHHHEQQHSHGEESEDDKYGGYTNVPHAVGSDFTGEELSAVLELMKDS